jgi:hypothetical protein
MVIKHNEYENTDNILGLGNLLLGSVIILVWDFPDRLIIIFLLHQICPSLFCFFWLFSDAFAPSLVDLMYVMILDGWKRRRVAVSAADPLVAAIANHAFDDHKSPLIWTCCLLCAICDDGK